MFLMECLLLWQALAFSACVILRVWEIHDSL